MIGRTRVMRVVCARAWIAASLAVMAVACEGSAEDDEAEVDEVAEAADEGEGIEALYDCVDPDLMASPLAGPGYDPQLGLIGEDAGTYLAHTTQVMIAEDDEALADFDGYIDAIVAQLMETDGLIAYSLATEPSCGFARTVGVWRDEQAMVAFALSGAHAEAMGQSSRLALTGRVTHWEVASDDLPELWAQALEQIEGVEPTIGY